MAPPSNEPFAAAVLRQIGGYNSHYLLIPPEIADGYRSAGVKRVIATLNGRPFNRAILGNADGERFLVVGLPILRDIKARPGDIVMIELMPDPEPDRIELGIEFTEVLELDDEAAERFYSFTPGRQRSMAYYVTSARREETRIKRSLDLAHKLRTRTLYGDREQEL
ncbi:MAG: YdeI/OmpD-associated family protein [Rhodothermales bacterium]|nr:YdeI/OmpD-associated family protein [Rhodothermales bacterium]